MFALSFDWEAAANVTPPDYPLSDRGKCCDQPAVLSGVRAFLNVSESTALNQLSPLYRLFGNSSGAEQLIRPCADIMEAIAKRPLVTGLTDVEQEMNGLRTYDQKTKVEPAQIVQVHRQMDAVR